MARFHFRLTSLLKLRSAARDEKRAHLAEAYKAANILEERLREVDAEIANAKEICGAAVRPGAIDVDHIMTAHRYEVVLLVQKNGLLDQQRKVNEEVERRRQALVEADRQVRVLEKLRERQEQEYRQIAEKKDQKLMDEIAARTHVATSEVSS